MITRAAYRLGKQYPQHDVRTLHFGDFITRHQLAVPPPARNWFDGFTGKLGMMENDKLGDCGFAAQGHGLMAWTFANHKLVTPSDAAVVQAYSGCTGYNPVTPDSDRGVVLLNALKFWRNVGIAGHKIVAFAKVDHHNLDHVRIAIDMFGGVYLGAGLPESAQDPGPWRGKRGTLSGKDEPYSWGGHCMWSSRYDRLGFGLITWGEDQDADNQWWLDYVDECYVPLSDDWAARFANVGAPSGFDFNRLQAALAQI